MEKGRFKWDFKRLKKQNKTLACSHISYKMRLSVTNFQKLFEAAFTWSGLFTEMHFVQSRKCDILILKYTELLEYNYPSNHMLFALMDIV